MTATTHSSDSGEIEKISDESDSTEDYSFIEILCTCSESTIEYNLKNRRWLFNNTVTPSTLLHQTREAVMNKTKSMYPHFTGLKFNLGVDKQTH